MPGRFASALSEHPVTAHAVGEAAGQVLEKLGPQPDVVAVFVTPPHAGALEDVAATVRSVLEPSTVVGCAAVSVLGDGREVEEGPAVSLWAARVGPVVPLRLRVEQTSAGSLLTGWPAELPFDPNALLLLADPFTFPAEALFAALHEERPGLPVLGGNASAAQGPGGNRLALDDQVVTDGAVGVVLGPGADIDAVVSQGCRPVGQPYTVTRAEHNVVYELGGQPAYQRLVETCERDLTEDELVLVNRGLHLGIVIDEHRSEFGRGDFLVRNVMGADPDNGAIGVNDVVEVGTTVQYHLRDAVTADEDLRALLGGRHADAALMFTCNGRGRRLFGKPHHDAGVLHEVLDRPPASGFFAAGEFGPVGGRNFVHGFTASVALFREAAG
jgi:small ligand-binding sensory domain FIST